MKKIILSLGIIIILFSTINTIAQKNTVEITTTQIAKLKGKYSKVINSEKKDTSYFVFMSFAYFNGNTFDLGSISFIDKEGVNEFITDLKTALPETGNKIKKEWKRKAYIISLYDFSAKLFLHGDPKEGDKNTSLTKEEVEKLITWLESFEFGKG
jgi:hypothetical protein